MNKKKDFDDLTNKRNTIYPNKSPNSDIENSHVSSKFIDTYFLPIIIDNYIETFNNVYRKFKIESRKSFEGLALSIKKRKTTNFKQV